MKRTYCRDCDNVTLATRKLYSSRWQCIKFPNLEGESSVNPDDFEPYNRCKSINRGFCPIYEPKREGKIPA